MMAKKNIDRRTQRQIWEEICCKRSDFNDFVFKLVMIIIIETGVIKGKTDIKILQSARKFVSYF